jgi:hypothetical protein
MERKGRGSRSLVAASLVAVVSLVLLAVEAGQPVHAEPQEQLTPAPASIATARDRAKMLHSVYHATLEVMHDRYFHGERATVPARALEDVFAEISRQAKVDARWISVNTRPMSIGHEPKGDFEKQAAKEITAGKGEYEQIEGGLYRRATPIPLTGSCVNCHVGFLADATKTPRFAGLIISMPVAEK